MMYCNPRRNPSLESVWFLASCGHPRAVRLRRDPGDLHGAVLQSHDEEDHVAHEAAQGQDLDGEEIGRGEALPMRREEGLPGRLRAPLRCLLDAMVLEDRLNHVAGDVVADALQPAADPRVAPGWVLGRHAHDERRDIWLGARATKAV